MQYDTDRNNLSIPVVSSENKLFRDKLSLYTGNSNDWCLRSLDKAQKFICLMCFFFSSHLFLFPFSSSNTLPQSFSCFPISFSSLADFPSPFYLTLFIIFSHSLYHCLSLALFHFLPSECVNAFALVVHPPTEQENLLFSFQLTGEETVKSAWLRTLCRHVANTICRADSVRSHTLTHKENKVDNLIRSAGRDGSCNSSASFALHWKKLFSSP